jgi:predicted phosphohydrolase
MTKIRIISDCHGKYDRLFPLLNSDEADYIIQLGDMGYDYSFLDSVPSDYLRILRGNHDHHINYTKYKHFLPDYGYHTLGNFNFFNVCGAFSIDWKLRQKYYFSGKWPQTWFPEEELSVSQLEKAVELYSAIRPSIMLTHEAPRSIAKIIGNPDILRDFGYDPKTFTTRTSEALECMLETHKPKLWCFGHYHRDFDVVINGTRFICKEELGFTDLTVREDGGVYVE